jgi:signal recognition particle receptor subunit beta
MAIFNYKKREISAKIVYYGPALCGKTTNVQYIHQKLNPRQRGELVSLATDADRTLFFDFLPIELENVGGFKTRFQIYTVPGQVYYNSTRKAVLTGVDGIIFVADSQTSMREEHLESISNLVDNLKYYNRDISQIPLVLQYNKRDLQDIMSLKELDELFAEYKNCPRYPAAAVTGQGVLETMTTCCKLVLHDLKSKSIRTGKAAAAPAAGPKPAAAGATAAARPAAAVNPVSPARPAGNLVQDVRPAPAAAVAAAAPAAGPVPETAARPTVSPLTGTIRETARIVQVGTPRLVDSTTVTLPLQLATDETGSQLLSIDITLNVNGIVKR